MSFDLEIDEEEAAEESAEHVATVETPSDVDEREEDVDGEVCPWVPMCAGMLTAHVALCIVTRVMRMYTNFTTAHEAVPC